MNARIFAGLFITLLMSGLQGCKKETEPPRQVSVPAEVDAPQALKPPIPNEQEAPAVPELKDTFETSSSYVFGVTYAPSINQYPGLAQNIWDYVQAARKDLETAASDDAPAGGDHNVPHELSLTFSRVAETPDLVVVAGDGSRYTGGAHGEPLVERFVWLPRQNSLLAADALIPTSAGWQVVSASVRESLQTAASLRVDAESLPPEDRALLVRQANKMIDEGTKPDPANFSRFVPVLDTAGKISALRFVFPPYQVAPYSEGTQQAEVAASVLLAYVAPAYRHLFLGGPELAASER